MRYALVLTGTTRIFRNLSFITSFHRYASLAAISSFKTKSEFGSTITVAASGLFDAPVTEELCTGTGWYHWNIQKSAEKLEQIIPV